MDCGYLGAAVIFTFVLALALGGYGIRIGNLVMVVGAVFGFAVVLLVYVVECTHKSQGM